MGAANELRDAIEAGRFVRAPGIYDALGARLAERRGFPAVYMSGLAVTAALLARPDLELLSMEEMVRQAALIVSAVGIPVIADADTGYGGLANVERTTRAYARAGAAAIHIEDQSSPKRCGHMSGVRLIDERDMIAKLEVAVAARGADPMLLVGRTDAAKVAGVDEAIRRARLIALTGVDLVFVDGLTRYEDFRRVRGEVEGRLLASIVEIDACAAVRAADLEALGYSVAIFALSGILAAAGALDRLMANLARRGDTEEDFGAMMTYSALNEVLGIGYYHELWNRHAQTGQGRVQTGTDAERASD